MSETRLEQELAGAAEFMRLRGLRAVIESSNSGDDSLFESVSFRNDQGQEVAQICFINRAPTSTSKKEAVRRSAIEGFLTEVVQPVRRAAAAVYREGSDLRDERFNALNDP